jgi:predicted metal-binding membrane protein
MEGPSMGLGAFTFLTAWTAMMVAMMFPTAAPMILMFARVQAGKRQQGKAFVATWIFVAGYLVLWIAFGLPVYGLAVAIERVVDQAGIAATGLARAGGLLILLAGLYQLSPLKRACLAHCRSPLHFVLNQWRDGALGALVMGVRHGVYCLGCCWLLFLLLLPLGFMNIGAMLLLTALIFAENGSSLQSSGADRSCWGARHVGHTHTVRSALLASHDGNVVLETRSYTDS